MIDVIKCNYFWNLHFLNARFSFACACACACAATISFCRDRIFGRFRLAHHKSICNRMRYKIVFSRLGSSFSFFILIGLIFIFIFIFYLWFWFWFLVDRFDRSKMSHVSYANEQTHIATTTTSTSNNSKRNFLFWNMETVLRDCATLVGSSPFKPHSLTFLHGSQFGILHFSSVFFTSSLSLSRQK